MAETKDELPVAGYINKFRNGDEEICFVDLRKYADGPEPCEVEPLTSHAAATSLIAELQRELAEARRDAERWRFYNEHANDWFEGHQLGPWLQMPGLWKHGTRNAAIDAARGEKKE